MDIEVPLLQTYVDGLDRALGGGIPRGSTVLVAGTPGTMKTSLILWMMHENARLNGVKSLYVSLEQDMDSLKAGAARMGMKNLHESSVYILDMGQLRRGLARSESSKDRFTILYEIIKEAVSASGYGALALDSLEALDALAAIKAPRRHRGRRNLPVAHAGPCQIGRGGEQESRDHAQIAESAQLALEGDDRGGVVRSPGHGLIDRVRDERRDDHVDRNRNRQVGGVSGPQQHPSGLLLQGIREQDGRDAVDRGRDDRPDEKGAEGARERARRGRRVLRSDGRKHGHAEEHSSDDANDNPDEEQHDRQDDVPSVGRAERLAPEDHEDRADEQEHASQQPNDRNP